MHSTRLSAVARGRPRRPPRHGARLRPLPPRRQAFLCQMGADDSRKHVARTCGREPGRRVDIDCGPARWRGNDRIRTLIDDHGMAEPCCGLRLLDLGQRRILGYIREEPGELPSCGVITTSPPSPRSCRTSCSLPSRNDLSRRQSSTSARPQSMSTQIPRLFNRSRSRSRTKAFRRLSLSQAARPAVLLISLSMMAVRCDALTASASVGEASRHQPRTGAQARGGR